MIRGPSGTTCSTIPAPSPVSIGPPPNARFQGNGVPAAWPPGSSVPSRAVITDSPCVTLRCRTSGRWVRPLNHTSPIDVANGLLR